MSRSLSRILMTSDCLGGVWTYTLDLAKGLSARGVETYLVLLGPPPNPLQYLALAANSAITPIETGLPLDWTATSERDLDLTTRSIADLAARFGVDLIHVHSPALIGSHPYPAPVVAGIHSCTTSWWRAVKSGPLPADFRWRRIATARGLEAADAVIVPSQSFADSLSRIHLRQFRVKVVPNGRPLRPRRTGSGNVIFTAGRMWDPAKNMQLLDCAAEFMDEPVFAAGPWHGPNGEYERFEHLWLLGELPPDRMARWYEDTAVFASASLYEPFGLAVLEAAMAGAALVLSDIDTFREIWDGAALFLPPNDPHAWASALQDLVRRPGLTARRGQSAFEIAGRYSSSRMVAETFAIYQDILRKRGVAAA